MTMEICAIDKVSMVIEEILKIGANSFRGCSEGCAMNKPFGWVH